ncbi:MFS transporter [Polymorphospora sp. NPDC051019]|uniref:MFS transporter n=1 Tax=Polymorphospora sp. NPDC051019 TaxID=3155725 RepID=UPI0034428F73
MTSPYRGLFALPGAAAFVAAGLAARLAHLTTVLGIVFLVSELSGSYGLGGLVSGAYALAYSLVAPLVGRLADRHRQGPVLMAAAIAITITRTGFLVAAASGAPAWVLVVLSATSGASMPAIGPFVRARWAHLLTGTPRLHAATSFESVVDELLLVIGPIVVSTVVVYLHPAAALILSVPLAAGGSIALALQHRTEPPGAPTGRPASGTAVRTPGLPLLLLTFALVSMVLIVLDVAVVAYARQHDAEALSGWILATIAAGSAVSGLWYGARDWSRPPHRRLAVVLPLLTVGTVPFIAVPATGWLFPAAFTLGLTLAPAFIDGFSIAARAVAVRHRTEGLTWLTTAAGIGISVGSATAGALVDSRGTTAAFALATGCAATAALAGHIASRRLTAP